MIAITETVVTAEFSTYTFAGPRTWEEKAVAPHSSTLAWKIPWTEEPGRLHSIGSLQVGHDRATSLSLFTFTFTHWRRKWQPTPVFLLGESQGAWWAAVYGVAQSWTRLKWLSSSSSRTWEVENINIHFLLCASRGGQMLCISLFNLSASLWKRWQRVPVYR